MLITNDWPTLMPNSRPAIPLLLHPRPSKDFIAIVDVTVIGIRPKDFSDPQQPIPAWRDSPFLIQQGFPIYFLPRP
jgi:hypothetical protein